jgi:hypothetical protein
LKVKPLGSDNSRREDNTERKKGIIKARNNGDIIEEYNKGE